MPATSGRCDERCFSAGIAAAARPRNSAIPLESLTAPCSSRCPSLRCVHGDMPENGPRCLYSRQVGGGSRSPGLAGCCPPTTHERRSARSTPGALQARRQHLSPDGGGPAMSITAITSTRPPTMPLGIRRVLSQIMAEWRARAISMPAVLSGLRHEQRHSIPIGSLVLLIVALPRRGLSSRTRIAPQPRQGLFSDRSGLILPRTRPRARRAAVKKIMQPRDPPKGLPLDSHESGPDCAPARADRPRPGTPATPPICGPCRFRRA